MDNYFKIYDYIKQSEPRDFKAAPYDLNYNILGLHKKRDWTKGQINYIEYYGDYEPTTNTYSNLVVKEYRDFYRINEFLNRRKIKVDWYLDNGEIGASKDNIWKYYTPAESLKAGEVRRRNVISNLKIASVGIIMQAYQMGQIDAEKEGHKFLEEFSSEIAQFIEGAQDPLKNSVLTTSNHPWLDAPLDPSTGLLARHYVYDEINIDYTENNVYI